MVEGNVDANFKKVVEGFVKNKIKDVKCVYEIIPNNNFYLSETIKVDNLEKSYKDLRRFEIILQLYINILNHEFVYKDFDVKFSFTEMSGDVSLESCYAYDEGGGVWKCKCRPKESEVVKAVYDYVLCFLSIDLAENIIKNSNVKGKVYNRQCSYCDSDIPPGQQICEICEARSDDVPTDARNDEEILLENEGGFGNNERIFENCNEENVINREDNASGILGAEENNVLNMDGGREVGRELWRRGENEGEELDKKSVWVCSKCSCKNEDVLVSCVACGEMKVGVSLACERCGWGKEGADDVCVRCVNGEEERDAVDYNNNNKNRGVSRDNTEMGGDRWTCLKCTCVNDDKEEVCRACFTVRKVPLGDGAIAREDRWECGKCGLIQSYEVSDCGVCYASMTESRQWTCGVCTLVNKSRDMKCVVCKHENCRLTKKGQMAAKANYSAKGRSNPNPAPRKDIKVTNEGSKVNIDQWECRNTNCKQPNSAKDMYCHMCFLDRFHSRVRGDPVRKRMKNGEIVSVWICHRCTKLNELKVNICAGKNCPEPRYEKI